MSSANMMDSSTQVPVVRCAWMHVVMSCRARHLMSSLPEVLALVGPAWYRKPLGEAVGNPRVSRAGERDEAG
jgi:hypothetical protein